MAPDTGDSIRGNPLVVHFNRGFGLIYLGLGALGFIDRDIYRADSFPHIFLLVACICLVLIGVYHTAILRPMLRFDPDAVRLYTVLGIRWRIWRLNAGDRVVPGEDGLWIERAAGERQLIHFTNWKASGRDLAALQALAAPGAK
jgi:hypothetical protein